MGAVHCKVRITFLLLLVWFSVSLALPITTPAEQLPTKIYTTLTAWLTTKSKALCRIPTVFSGFAPMMG